MLNIDAETTAVHLSFATLVPALRQAFEEGCESPLRHQHPGLGGSDSNVLLLMPSWSQTRFGIKIVNVFPDNNRLDLPRLHASYLLGDAKTGQHLAMVDGDQLTDRRTAAASALAASYLARKDAETLLVLGAGRIGSLMAAAYASVRRIRKILVWNRTPDRAGQLVEKLRADGYNAELAEDLPRAVGRADCISCGTLSEQPLICGQWLLPGTHVDLIGSFTPEMRETDDEVMSRASIFIDTEDALAESGDLIQPMANGILDKGEIQADLYQLCRKKHLGRRSEDEITVFKSVGTALEDLAGADLVYRNVIRQGAG